MLPPKNKKGFIPIFVLIGIIFVVAAGGAFTVRQAFKNKSPQDKTKVEDIIQKVENPALGPIQLGTEEDKSSDNAPKPPNTPAAVQEEFEGEAGGEPGFTLSPPGGWLKSSTSAKNAVAYFIAPEEDKEKVENGTFTNRANIVVRRSKADPGQTLDKMTSSVKEELTANCKSVSHPVDSKINLNGTEVQQLETICDLDKIKLHSFGYFMVVNGYQLITTGTASDAAWSKWSGQIKSSLSTFTVTE